MIVEHLTPGRKWKRLGNLTTNRNGIFERTLPAQSTGWVRARLGSHDATLPFSLQPVPDRFFDPSGLPFLLEAKRH